MHGARLFLAATASCAALLCACAGRAPPSGARATRVDLHLTSANGLSGLAQDDAGALWAIAEHDRVLVRIVRDHVEATVPLDGVPDGVDTESLAYLGGGTFAAGTESPDETRTSDLVLVIHVDGARARVVERIELPYALAGVHAEANHGVEGLCFADGALYAVLENVLDGPRRAPLLRYAMAGRRWTASAVPLTTERGTLSGLACRVEHGAVVAYAVERHFAAMRVLRFDPTASHVTPTVMLPLEGALDAEPNLEGIELVGGDVVMVVDNDYGGVTGPNELVRVRAR